MTPIEIIAAALPILRAAPQVIEAVQIWVASGHEPTPAEIQALVDKYELNRATVQADIAAAKARLSQP